MQSWLDTPAGQYLLDWERAQFDQVVADIFGYHALQLGLAPLQALQANRMPHRWLAVPTAGERMDSALDTSVLVNRTAAAPTTQTLPIADLVTDFAALPFFENSLDLLVLPHSLELSPDPHATLREAQRVLVPEGKLVICGFNPLSLWGMKQRRGHLYRRLRKMSQSKTSVDTLEVSGFGDLFLPEAGEFIGYRRLKDWLQLLNFELESGKFGCYRPAVQSEKWLQRCAWMDKVGPQYWSILGAVYFVVAVKRVHGMRMLSPHWKERHIKVGAPVSIANKAHFVPGKDEF